jgi:hypothetical protein
VPSFLSEPGPLICVGPARARIEPGRAVLGSGPNSGLRAGLVGLVLIGHLYFGVEGKRRNGVMIFRSEATSMNQFLYQHAFQG